MRALFVEDGRLSLVERPRPEPGSGEALIRVRCAGICSTDLEIVRGYAGYRGILGHEFAGEVVATGEGVDAAWLGRRVVGSINVGCRACAVCADSGPEHCPNRRVVGIMDWDGVFADYTRLPVANLLRVPDGLADEEAVFTEPLAASLRIREQVPAREGERIAVIGPGRMGLLIGQVLARSGGQVIVLGRRLASLALPAQLGLATGLVNDAPDGRFDLVVEATGNDQGLAAAIRLLRPEGTLVLKSTYAGKATVDLSPVVVNELRVVGSRCGPFAPALAALSLGEVVVQPLIDGRFALRDGLAAFARADEPGVRKVLLFPG